MPYKAASSWAVHPWRSGRPGLVGIVAAPAKESKTLSRRSALKPTPMGPKKKKDAAPASAEAGGDETPTPLTLLANYISISRAIGTSCHRDAVGNFP
eukprot:scaffold1659_cov255-Pinguiococcus_pyrenoidosus.AAC.39